MRNMYRWVPRWSNLWGRQVFYQPRCLHRVRHMRWRLSVRSYQPSLRIRWIMWLKTKRMHPECTLFLFSPFAWYHLRYPRFKTEKGTIAHIATPHSECEATLIPSEPFRSENKKSGKRADSGRRKACPFLHQTRSSLMCFVTWAYPHEQAQALKT